MPDTATCKCIACQRPMTNIAEDGTLQPSGGTAFQTRGHYGSTVFDPMDGSLLEIAVCDGCLTAASLHGNVVLVDHDGARPNPMPGDGVEAEPTLVAERVMDGAGHELMALSRRLAERAATPEEAARLHMIGAWIVVDRPSDLQNAMIKVLGEIVAHMRSRGFDFDYDKPVTTQVNAFLDTMQPAPAG